MAGTTAAVDMATDCHRSAARALSEKMAAEQRRGIADKGAVATRHCQSRYWWAVPGSDAAVVSIVVVVKAAAVDA